ncbi:hypothetical protein RND71_006940 [Anisodus tanguticus]|uniref:Tify domain-containing protein n=1 Tax=Anisodus tanguticus TaxID=243964 RepID=A0AAE1SV48_9SOLA|nr:hypothetical protein RND71_006940 [Anisodus tanguticus]
MTFDRARESKVFSKIKKNIIPAAFPPTASRLASKTDSFSVDDSRSIGTAVTPVGQMTIFYSGKVNMYDDVPVDKVFKLAENWELQQISVVALFLLIRPTSIFLGTNNHVSCFKPPFVCLQKLQ